MAQSTTSALLAKFQRALRNKQGTQFTLEELQYMARLGALHLITKAETDELVADLGGLISTPPPKDSFAEWEAKGLL